MKGRRGAKGSGGFNDAFLTSSVGKEIQQAFGFHTQRHLIGCAEYLGAYKRRIRFLGLLLFTPPSYTRRTSVLPTHALNNNL
jgi:hypothetical protein